MIRLTVYGYHTAIVRTGVCAWRQSGWAATLGKTFLAKPLPLLLPLLLPSTLLGVGLEGKWSRSGAGLVCLLCPPCGDHSCGDSKTFQPSEPVRIFKNGRK
jgi:hypothetical protein